MTFDLSSVGWDGGLAAAYAAHDRADHRPGRVTRVDRGVCAVLTDFGAERASPAGTLLAAAARDPRLLPCAGDWVVIRSWPDQRLTVEAVLPRRNAIVRRVAGRDSHGQVLAANLDAAAVVEPMWPEPDLSRIERLLALAWESGAPPLVLLTKADMVGDPDAVAAQAADAAPGVEVRAVSVHWPDSVEAVRPLVGWGRTLGLLGRSGAGKSTLVNALAGTDIMTTRELRGDGKGRHTTTYRTLVVLPGAGAVLDTPGIKVVGLLDSEDGLDQAFTDVAGLAAGCRFNDCRHEGEPGCAVRAAIESGDLPPRRLASWRKLQKELAYQMRRQDARLAAEQRDRWKQIHREVRRARGNR